jgi:hypothetical protein
LHVGDRRPQGAHLGIRQRIGVVEKIHHGDRPPTMRFAPKYNATTLNRPPRGRLTRTNQGMIATACL